MNNVGATGRSPIHDVGKKSRHSVRLKNFDYSSPGAYFITICAHDHECLFGKVIGENGKLSVCLSDYGKIVNDEWLKSGEIRKEIILDDYVLMPNHFHGIIFLRKGDQPVAPTMSGPRPGSIGSTIAGFKSAVTTKINTLRNTPGVPIWQRNYYERVIRNETELNSIREYIKYNPLNWETDEEFVGK